ncbi:unnamed protein product [Lepeophtheirus salmonis]|uniref:(salmon louse) hypothetical protein n=1 Tax=Lepeophtheirus salmonis TaxID=72036 RepID=A0A7R8H9Z3_LEPSM|nr:unnamed protein product [Lepeophtheirus salmonis]CAF2957185.1 unnamed protein product [Lepeophtheirus salmonis]
MQEEGGEQSSVNPQKDEQLPIASPVAEAAAVVPVPPPPPPLPVPADPPSSQQDAGYLSLLAHISSAQRRVAEKEEALRSDSPSLPEEPAAKRTQMWLAQLGRYRQKSVQYEIEKNHEELWEEQIAKIKQNPREEEDDEEGGYLHLGGVEEHEQEHHHHVPGLIMTEEANIKEERAAEEERIIMGEPHDPLQLQLQAYEDQRGVSPPPSSPHQLKHIVSLPNTHSPPSTCKNEDDPELISSDGSVLKSILLDRIGRKRPSLDPTPVPPKANHQEDSTDILRRRLLGLKEEPVLLVVDVESDNNNKSSNSSNSNIKNSSNKISNNLRDSNIKKDEQSSSPENNKSSPKKKEEEGKSSIIEQKGTCSKAIQQFFSKTTKKGFNLCSHLCSETPTP